MQNDLDSKISAKVEQLARAGEQFIKNTADNMAVPVESMQLEILPIIATSEFGEPLPTEKISICLVVNDGVAFRLNLSVAVVLGLSDLGFIEILTQQFERAAA